MMSSVIGNDGSGAVRPAVRCARILGLILSVACGGDSDGETSGANEGSSSSTASTSSGTTTSSSSTSTESSSGATGSESGAVDSTSTGSGSSESGGGGTVVLQNDSWTPADSLFWNTWANVDDCWASSYDIDPGLFPVELVSIQVAIGGTGAAGGDMQPFDVRVYTVDAMGAPDQLIDSVQVDIQGNAPMVPEIVVADVGLVVPPIDSGSFAVAMCHVSHMGAPSIGSDADGSVDAGNNWVWQDIMGNWVSAPDFFGIDGDFIMRAVVQTGG